MFLAPTYRSMVEPSKERNLRNLFSAGNLPRAGIFCVVAFFVIGRITINRILWRANSGHVGWMGDGAGWHGWRHPNSTTWSYSSNDFHFDSPLRLRRHEQCHKIGHLFFQSKKALGQPDVNSAFVSNQRGCFRWRVGDGAF